MKKKKDSGKPLVKNKYNILLINTMGVDLSESVLNLILSQFYLYQPKVVKPMSKEDKSKLEKKVSELSKKKEEISFKKIIFNDPTKVSDASLNTILDAFSRIGFKNGSFISQFNSDSVSKALMVFNRWINIEQNIPEAEDIFKIMPSQEAEVVNPLEASVSTFSKYNSFNPEQVYTPASQESSMSNYSTESADSGESFYSRNERDESEQY